MEKNKPRIQSRQKTGMLPLSQRLRTFEEVNVGFSEEQALTEASRCLQCSKAFCMAGCPANVQIPKFIRALTGKDYRQAIEVICETNSLPAITGRVCQVELQCEKACILSKSGNSIAIGALERFVADMALRKGWKAIQRGNPNGKRVAVIGSGPAGLTAAGDLIKRGYEVTIFEALHKAGGVLSYGIPDFRLPKDIVEKEVGTLTEAGVKIMTNVCIGRTMMIDELFKKGYCAVFIGIGAGAPVMPNIPGSNLNGIYTANEFLVRAVLMRAYQFPKYDTPIRVGKEVIVIGGGNTAVDSARVALRLGADKVVIAYRRREDEMPARVEEVTNAKEEGVKIMPLVSPKRFIGNELNHVKAVECVRNQPTYIDATGRSHPEPIEGTNFWIDADTVITATGQKANQLISQTTPDLRTDSDGYLLVDYNAMTSKPLVWAGGDIIGGSATVIQAIGDAKRAAANIDKVLRESKNVD
ncbi:MAG: NADPH-dependent glutamate synthase [Nitrososphaeria archaeon]